MIDLASEPWDPLTVDEVVERFSLTDVDWWIAGGLAIDCFLGWRTRPHADVDVEMFRHDRERLFSILEGWDLFAVSKGDLTPWFPGRGLRDDVFGIWGRPSPEHPWAIEVILADGDESTWRFRRDPKITLPRERLTAVTEDGIRYCTPEVQLLYKAKLHRPKDDADMVRCLHRMSTAQLAWLVEAVASSEPDHPWLDLITHHMQEGAK